MSPHPTPIPRRTGRALVLACAAGLTLLSTPGPAAATDVHADYIVLLDNSQSMAAPNRYPLTLAALPRLFEGLPAADHVSLSTFGRSVQNVYTGPPRSAAYLVGRLPAQPTADATDLGPAIGAALDELERADAAPVAGVLLITDGLPDPPPDSPYADPASPAWAALVRRAHAVLRDDKVIYPVLLGAGGFDDAEAARVLGNTVVLHPGDLDRYRNDLATVRTRAETAEARVRTGAPSPASTAPGAAVPAPASRGESSSGTALLAGLAILAAIAAGTAAVLVRRRRRRPLLDGQLLVTSGADDRELARFDLSGHRMSLRDPGLPGIGTITPIGSTADGTRGGDRGLRIAYSRTPGEKAVSGRCRPGHSIILGGYVFHYLGKVSSS